MLQETIQGVAVALQTHPDLFSPRGVDRGTRAMLSLVTLQPEDKVLDLGCGCGVVGIWVAKQIGADCVTMCDIDPLAVATAAGNAEANGVGEVRLYQGDGLQAVPDAGYTKILCNPPYHTDFSVAKRFIEKGFNRLALQGELYMVTKRRTWYENKIRAIFGGLRVEEIDGYCVFCAQKRSTQYANKKG